MATLKEVWVDDYTLTITDSRGTRRINGTAAAFDDQGTRVRVGNADITEDLSEAGLAAVQTLLDETRALVLEQCGIAEGDLAPESPFGKPEAVAPLPPPPLPGMFS